MWIILTVNYLFFHHKIWDLNYMNACFAMSCLQKICSHIGPSELKAVSGTAAKVVQYEVVPCTQQRCHWPERGPGPPCVCCLDPEVPDSQSISTNEGYLIYSDTPGQDWSTLNNLRTSSIILILLLHLPIDWIKLRQFHLSFGLVPDQILWIWQFLRLSKNSTNNIAVTTLKLMLRILQRNP